MNPYLLVGQRYVGGSDFGSGRRFFEPVQIEFKAENDEAAEEKTRKEYDYVTHQKLYREVALP